MRVAGALIATLALALAHAHALAHHGDTLLTYAEGSGHFVAGLVAIGVGAPDDGEPIPPSGVGPVNLARFDFAAHPCHPDLRMQLAFTPANATLGTDDAALIVPYRFQVKLVDAATGEDLPDATFDFARPGLASYALPAQHARGGALRADLYMIVGADAEWSFALRGWLEHEGCVLVSEVEANPDGVDAGAEWIELVNLGFGAVDLSGWTIRAHHGAPEALTLANGTTIPGGGQLVVPFPAQFLDNVDEVVTLEAPDGVEYARTPALTDGADDARTQQLVPETGSAWTFQAGTRGLPN